MAGLNHDFMLLACEQHPIKDWNLWYHNPNAILIHHDVLEYMADTLKWIPTYNPATKRQCQGLNWYGPTVILEAGAEIAAKIFYSWADLFTCGPEDLRLTGAFGWQLENDPDKDGFERVVPDSAGYERLILGRDKLITSLRILAFYADRVRQTRRCILHLAPGYSRQRPLGLFQSADAGHHNDQLWRRLIRRAAQ